MKSFTKSFTEFINTHFVEKTKPRLIWLNNKYIVTWYYSDQTINRLGGKIIL